MAGSLPPLPPLADDLDGLDAFALDERLRAVVAALHAVDWETGRLLRLLFDLRLHTMFGFPDTGSYVRERLGFSPRKAGALVAVERATWYAPALAEAYQAGRISWFRALLVLPILRETTAAAWVARSAEVTAGASATRSSGCSRRRICNRSAPRLPRRLAAPRSISRRGNCVRAPGRAAGKLWTRTATRTPLAGRTCTAAKIRLISLIAILGSTPC